MPPKCSHDSKKQHRCELAGRKPGQDILTPIGITAIFLQEITSDAVIRQKGQHDLSVEFFDGPPEQQKPKAHKTNQTLVELRRDHRIAELSHCVIDMPVVVRKRGGVPLNPRNNPRIIPPWKFERPVAVRSYAIITTKEKTTDTGDSQPQRHAGRTVVPVDPTIDATPPHVRPAPDQKANQSAVSNQPSFVIFKKIGNVNLAVGLETKCIARAPIKEATTITNMPVDAVFESIPSRRER